MICGSNVPARFRGTSIPTCPVLSVSTVFGRVPLRLSLPAAACFSWPRCSVISWFRAVSRTTLVSCFSSPSGPVRDRPCSLARRTSSSAARCSADGSAFFFVTFSSVAVITAPLRRTTGSAIRAGNTVNYTVPSMGRHRSLIHETGTDAWLTRTGWSPGPSMIFDPHPVEPARAGRQLTL